VSESLTILPDQKTCRLAGCGGGLVSGRLLKNERLGFMKTILLNGSPRKNWNTAMMLKEAQKGAESVGAETEYIDLFDLSYTGCRSCLACKRKGAERCKCFWKDDLSPVIDRIFAADALIIGSPIYLGDVTSQVHGLIERLHFCALSYDDYSNYFTGKVNVGIILTMNAPKAFYSAAYGGKAKEIEQSFKGLNGSVETYACCDTLQVKDYSRYNMAGFDENHKKEMREKQFPNDLKEAFRMGARLSEKK
jgi:multimeric flavodoxin WrbA